ncbi:hypothetical protein KEM56_002532 [Ascosphaera pollenicola]|nr:hypothetical protein KEM56_002532 [Ascosphaera pollenicola]
MIGATRRWLRRKRGPIAIGVGVIGAGYLAGQYVISKINEARERMASERTARENLRRRFEQNQADCTFTVLGLLYTATENICQALPVEQLTQELQQKKKSRRLSRKSIGEASADGSSVAGAQDAEENQDSSSRRGSQAEAEATAAADAPKQKSRMQLWNELKILSLTRSFTLLYTLSLLTILTRIQLNLLGRRSYLASVVSLASPTQQFSGISLEDHDDETLQSSLYGGDFETDKRYLAFSWWLLHRGWKDIMETVKEAVIDVFGPISPREEISQEKLSELTREVRKRVEGDTNEARLAKRWLPFMLPPRDQEEAVLREAGVPMDDNDPNVLADGSLLRTLLDETSDLIDSPPFCEIVIALNDEGFSLLVDRNCALEVFNGYRSTAFASEHIDPQSLESSMSTDLSQLSGSKVKFANILATISRQAHVIGNSTEPPNEYLTTLEANVRELEAFAAVVYSNNLGLDEFQRQELTEVPPAEMSSSESETAPEGLVHRGEDDGDDADKAFDEVWGKASGSQSSYHHE